MTSDAYSLLSSVLSQSWRFFTEWLLPGTHATIGDMAFFLLTAYLTIRFFLRVGQVSASDNHNSK